MKKILVNELKLSYWQLNAYVGFFVNKMVYHFYITMYIMVWRMCALWLQLSGWVCVCVHTAVLANKCWRWYSPCPVHICSYLPYHHHFGVQHLSTCSQGLLLSVPLMIRVSVWEHRIKGNRLTHILFGKWPLKV